MGALLDRVAEVAERYNIHFIISMSCDETEIPEKYQSCLIQ